MVSDLDIQRPAHGFSAYELCSTEQFTFRVHLLNLFFEMHSRLITGNLQSRREQTVFHAEHVCGEIYIFGLRIGRKRIGEKRDSDEKNIIQRYIQLVAKGQ